MLESKKAEHRKEIKNIVKCINKKINYLSHFDHCYAYDREQVILYGDGEFNVIHGNAFSHMNGLELMSRLKGVRVCIYRGNIHSENGPSIILEDGTRYWFKEGKCHCENGPAVEYPDVTCEWWLYDKEYTKEEFNAKLEKIKTDVEE